MSDERKSIVAAGQHKLSHIHWPKWLLLELRPKLDSFLMHLGWERAAARFQGGAGNSKEGSCRTTELHRISFTLWKSVVASLMCPHLEAQKWTKCCWKWRREGSHKWNSMSDHYREELRGCVGEGRREDGESLTLASPDLSIFDYGRLHTDLMLITSQFSWGTFSFAQSHIRSIQLVTTANGTFIIPQVHRNPLFGLAHKFKGHRRGYNTCCNYLSCVPWGNPGDATSRARRKSKLGARTSLSPKSAVHRGRLGWIFFTLWHFIY